VRKLLLPMLQADFQLIETWRPPVSGDAAVDGMQEGGEQAPPEMAHQLPAVPCPIVALGATEDARYCWY
jgi:surfactin synthase thioesterase subunit